MNEETTEKVHAELVKVGDKTGLNQNEEAVAIREQFAGLYGRVQEALIVVPSGLSGDNPGHVRIARTTRLALKDIRCEVETARKTMKEGVVRRGKAIDGWANVLKDMIAAPEQQMQEVENYAERKELERVAALVSERTEVLLALGADPTAYNLGAMKDVTWIEVAKQAKAAKIAREESARKAEEEKVAAEKTRREEEERVKAENVRLKAEAEAREKQMQDEIAAAVKKQLETEAKAVAERAAERKAAEAKLQTERKESELKLQQERDARTAVERDIAESQRKEQERIEAEQEAAEKAAQAPDKEKLIALAATIDEMAFPAMKTKRGKDTLRKAEMMLSEVADFLKEQAEVM